METKKLSQKEYLKKYLSGGDKKKKQKKKKVQIPKVQIIDDDINLDSIRPMDDAEFDIVNATEDAPVIVGIIDERGPVDFANRKKWKIIADDGDGNIAVSSNQNYTDNLQDNNKKQLINKSTNHNRVNSVDETLSDDDQATSRQGKSSGKRRRKQSDSDSPESYSKNERRSNKSKRPSPDKSPPRSSENRKNSSKSSRHVSDSDLSPPRSKKNKHQNSERYNSDSDMSPPRKSKHQSRESRKTRQDSDLDLSPPRKSKNNSRDSRKNKRDSDLDLSPPRKSKNHSRKTRRNSDSDLSPPRKSKNNSRKARQDSDTDLSPPRKSKNYSRESRRDSDLDLSPPRKSRPNGRKHSRWSNNSARSPTPEVNGRPRKTLDGKTAGLQNAKALSDEVAAHKQKEKEMFSKMSAEVSGFGQAAVVRDRKTGKRRDFAAEDLERQEKEKRQKEIDDQYAKWGRGLKQVNDREEKLKQDLYEMSKPLARYADDADLDAQQRAVQHDFEDPMRLFVKEKQPKPLYSNSSMPNRYGIKPGHRWDGVDRSNGYEKKWFEAKNARKAIQEEAYKWSTSDM